jgi:hypothetical protein
MVRIIRMWLQDESAQKGSSRPGNGKHGEIPPRAEMH